MHKRDCTNEAKLENNQILITIKFHLCPFHSLSHPPLLYLPFTSFLLASPFFHFILVTYYSAINFLIIYKLHTNLLHNIVINYS